MAQHPQQRLQRLRSALEAINNRQDEVLTTLLRSRSPSVRKAMNIQYDRLSSQAVRFLTRLEQLHTQTGA